MHTKKVDSLPNDRGAVDLTKLWHYICLDPVRKVSFSFARLVVVARRWGVLGHSLTLELNCGRVLKNFCRSSALQTGVSISWKTVCLINCLGIRARVHNDIKRLPVTLLEHWWIVLNRDAVNVWANPIIGTEFLRHSIVRQELRFVQFVAPYSVMVLRRVNTIVQSQWVKLHTE